MGSEEQLTGNGGKRVLPQDSMSRHRCGEQRTHQKVIIGRQQSGCLKLCPRRKGAAQSGVLALMLLLLHSGQSGVHFSSPLLGSKCCRISFLSLRLSPVLLLTLLKKALPMPGSNEGKEIARTRVIGILLLLLQSLLLLPIEAFSFQSKQQMAFSLLLFPSLPFPLNVVHHGGQESILLRRTHLVGSRRGSTARLLHALEWELQGTGLR